jgi:hypothetical protein
VPPAVLGSAAFRPPPRAAPPPLSPFPLPSACFPLPRPRAAAMRPAVGVPPFPRPLRRPRGRRGPCPFARAFGVLQGVARRLRSAPPWPGARAARCGRSQLPPQSSLPFNGAGRRCAHYPPAPVCAFSLRVVLGACRRAVWGACWAGVWRLSCDPRWRHYCPGLMCLQLPCLPVRALSLSAPRPAPRLASRRKPGGRPRAEGWGGGFLALRRLAAGLFFPNRPTRRLLAHPLMR